MKQIPSRPNGVMEWWNIGMLILKKNYLISKLDNLIKIIFPLPLWEGIKGRGM